MRVLITGVTGLIGSHLADFLAETSDAELYGLKLWRSDTFITSQLNPRVTLFEGDILDPFSMDRIVGEVRPDRLFHLAAQSYPLESLNAPSMTLQTNILGTLNVLEAVRHHVPACQVHIAGSAAEYGAVEPSDLPIQENHSLRPLTPYGVSKVAAELLGYQYFVSYGIPVYLTRSFNHVGSRQGERSSVQSFCRQMALIEQGVLPPLIQVGNLEARRDFTGVRDAVRALWLLLEKGRPGEVYNLCSGAAPSIREVLGLVIAGGKIPVKVEERADRLRSNDEPVLVGNNSKLMRDTGWSIEGTLSVSVQQILEYWRFLAARGILGRR